MWWVVDVRYVGYVRLGMLDGDGDGRCMRTFFLGWGISGLLIGSVRVEGRREGAGRDINGL